jgi:hypothetical protein
VAQLAAPKQRVWHAAACCGSREHTQLAHTDGTHKRHMQIMGRGALPGTRPALTHMGLLRWLRAATMRTVSSRTSLNHKVRFNRIQLLDRLMKEARLKKATNYHRSWQQASSPRETT